MLILPKTSGEGTKVDGASPTYAWRDIIGQLMFNTGGANAPAITAFRGGNSRALKFVASDRVDFIFHIPHDWAPSSDLYLHVHWCHNGTAISGNAAFQFDYTYAKGHNQANFPAEKTQTITYATTDITTTPQYRHRIDELQLSNSGGTGNYLDTASIEPDGLITVGLSLATLPTITAGNLFIFTCDLHYQGVEQGTKQKAPAFYT